MGTVKTGDTPVGSGRDIVVRYECITRGAFGYHVPQSLFNAQKSD